MPKIKVHSGAAKRFKKTGSGIKRKHANKSHILTKMTTKSKRQLRGTVSLACLLYTSPSPRDAIPSRMPSSA